MTRQSEMYFAGIRLQSRRILQRGVSEGEPRRRVINVEEIKLIVHVGQKAVSGHKPRVAFDRLVKQTSSLQKMWFQLSVKTMVVRDWLCSHVETKRNQVACGSPLDRRSFARCKFRLQLVGNRFRDLALNGEKIGKVAVISLCPEVRIVARVDQLRVYSDLVAGALYTALKHMRHAEFARDLA